MKKLIFPLIVFGGLFLLGTMAAEAAEAIQMSDPPAQVVGSGFTDSNGDGVCDNYDGNRPGEGKGPGNGLGLGQADGKGLGQGNGLQDGSGNGQRKLDGSGNGQRKLDGSGAGLNKGNGRQDGSAGKCTPK